VMQGAAMSEVVRVKPNMGDGNPREKWLKRQALQLAGQLPDDTEEALRVLAHLKWLVTEFLEEDKQPIRRA